MTPTARQIAENVAVLLVRTDMTNKDLGRTLGISPQSVGQRLRGRIEWRAAELDVLARALHVTPSELMGRLPDFKEWDRRTAAPGPIAAAGPRYLVMPEGVGDGTPPLAPLSPASMDIMSLRVGVSGQTSCSHSPRRLPARRAGRA